MSQEALRGRRDQGPPDRFADDAQDHGRHHGPRRRVRGALVRGRAHEGRPVARRHAHLRARRGAPRGAADGDHRARRRRGAGRRTPRSSPPTWTASFPQGFYSTTNLETLVRVKGEWVPVEHPEMDCGIRVDVEAGTAETVAMGDVKAGELYVTGHKGIRVLPLERPRESQPFEFMASAVSSEKPKAQIVHEVARLLRQVKDEGRLDDRRGRARRSCTRGRRRAWPASSRRATSAPSSAATPSPRTTSRRTSSGRRWASTSSAARPWPAATSTTCAPSTPSGAAVASRPPSSRACSPAASCTRSSRRGRRSSSPAASATTVRCPR